MIDPVTVTGCTGGLYEPGVTHEHKCLATMDHGHLSHTCRCGKTWPSFRLAFDDRAEVMREQASELLTAANQAEGHTTEEAQS